MKLYTKTGDKGETGLIGGPRVSKDHPRVCAYGEVDELNAVIGLAVASLERELQGDAGQLIQNPDSTQPSPESQSNDPSETQSEPTSIMSALRLIQSDLFVIGAQLANPNGEHWFVPMEQSDITRLESWIDAATAEVTPLTNFILPGGCESATRLHHARTVCRRAEREVVALSQSDTVEEICITYLNRLSDLIFAWARWTNKRVGVADVVWKPKIKPDQNTK